MTEKRFVFGKLTRLEQLRWLLRKIPNVGAYRNSVKSAMESSAYDYRAVITNLQEMAADEGTNEITFLIRAVREHVRPILFHLGEMQKLERSLMTLITSMYDEEHGKEKKE